MWFCYMCNAEILFCELISCPVTEFHQTAFLMRIQEIKGICSHVILCTYRQRISLCALPIPGYFLVHWLIY
jgi:hypothetical protein